MPAGPRSARRHHARGLLLDHAVALIELFQLLRAVLVEPRDLVRHAGLLEPVHVDDAHVGAEDRVVERALELREPVAGDPTDERRRGVPRPVERSGAVRNMDGLARELLLEEPELALLCLVEARIGERGVVVDRRQLAPDAVGRCEDRGGIRGGDVRTVRSDATLQRPVRRQRRRMVGRLRHHGSGTAHGRQHGPACRVAHQAIELRHRIAELGPRAGELLRDRRALVGLELRRGEEALERIGLGLQIACDRLDLERAVLDRADLAVVHAVPIGHSTLCAPGLLGLGDERRDLRVEPSDLGLHLLGQVVVEVGHLGRHRRGEHPQHLVAQLADRAPSPREGADRVRAACERGLDVGDQHVRGVEVAALRAHLVVERPGPLHHLAREEHLRDVRGKRLAPDLDRPRSGDAIEERDGILAIEVDRGDLVAHRRVVLHHAVVGDQRIGKGLLLHVQVAAQQLELHRIAMLRERDQERVDRPHGVGPRVLLDEGPHELVELVGEVVALVRETRVPLGGERVLPGLVVETRGRHRRELDHGAIERALRLEVRDGDEVRERFTELRVRRVDDAREVARASVVRAVGCDLRQELESLARGRLAGRSSSRPCTSRGPSRAPGPSRCRARRALRSAACRAGCRRISSWRRTASAKNGCCGPASTMSPYASADVW